MERFLAHSFQHDGHIVTNHSISMTYYDHCAVTAIVLAFVIVLLSATNLNGLQCDNGTVTISNALVNDDYCDCHDGADETLTPACPRARFVCQNNGFLSKTIPSGFIDDGVCDCCDGSDERVHVNNVHCPLSCIDEARTYIAAERARLQQYQLGLTARSQLTSAVAQAKDSLEKERVWLQQTYPKVQSSFNELLPQWESLTPAQQTSDTRLRPQLQELHNYLEQFRKRQDTIYQVLGIREVIDENAMAKAENARRKAQQKKKARRNADNDESELPPIYKTVSVPSSIGSDTWLALSSVCLTHRWDRRRYGAFGLAEDHYNITLCPFSNVTQTSIEEEEAAPLNGTTSASVVKLGLFEFRVHNWTTLQSANRYDAEVYRRYARRINNYNQRRRQPTAEEVAAEDATDRDEEVEWQLAETARVSAEHNSGLSMVEKSGVRPPQYYLRYVHGDACFDTTPRRVIVRALCGQDNVITQFIENGKCQYEMSFTTPAACNAKYYIEWKKKINQIETNINKKINKDEL